MSNMILARVWQEVSTKGKLEKRNYWGNLFFTLPSES
jgi:hypothetical protein